MGVLSWLLLIPFFAWLAWLLARQGGWLGYLAAMALLVLPTVVVAPSLNGSAGAGNFGSDLFIVFVMLPSIGLALITGGFGVAKWRATTQWEARHGGANDRDAHDPWNH